MPRDLPLSNGRLLVNFDSHYNLRDIHFPHVGKANHAHGCMSRLGVWMDGAIKWHESDGWQLDLRYQSDTLATHVTAENAELGLMMTLQDAVDFHLNVLVRRIEISNKSSESHDVRLFLHHDFSLWGTTVGDTAFYHPGRRALIAYKDKCYILINGMCGEIPGLDSWTTGHKDTDLGTGSWEDAEDGELDQMPVAFGSVDCVGALHLGQIPPGQTKVVYSWMAVGESLEEVLDLDQQIVKRGPQALLKRTTDYWRAWVTKETTQESNLLQVSQTLRDLYTRSLLIMRTQIDHDGGVIAATDSDISRPYHSHDQPSTPIVDPFHGHEHYSYVWPRDGSLASLALIRAGYGELSRQFIFFCSRTLSYDEENDWGYMLQRYQADGVVASNVIPWIDEEGNPKLPIQEDETGLVLFLLGEHYRKYRDWEVITPLYRNFVKTMGNFLFHYRDSRTGLPLPSQDLWEERDGIHAFTVATTWAGLQAAAQFTDMFGEHDLADDYRRAAQEIKQATEDHLYDKESGRFLRTIWVQPDGEVVRDKVVDASLYALFYFKMFAVDDPRIERTMQSVIQRLSVPTPCGGIARYEGDTYQRVLDGDSNSIPGNPWFICTLWVAQYHIRKARSLEELEPARKILDWVGEHALPSGVLAEQLDPHTGDPVGTSPLTWSHGTLVLTITEYTERYLELSGLQTVQV